MNATQWSRIGSLLGVKLTHTTENCGMVELKNKGPLIIDGEHAKKILDLLDEVENLRRYVHGRT